MRCCGSVGHATGQAPSQGFGPLDFDSQGAFAGASAYYQAQPAVDWVEADLTDEQFVEVNAAILEANTVPPALLSAPV